MRIVVALLVCAAMLVPSRVHAQVAPPNIILIVYDDATKADVEAMPNIKTLIGDQGMTFDRFYATESLCCPDRSSLLLGQYVHDHRVFSNLPPDGGFVRFRKLGHERETVARSLQADGYATGLVGKYLNGYGLPPSSPRHVAPFWDRWFATIQGRYYDYQADVDGHLRHYDSHASDYIDRVIGRNARSFIDRHSGPTFTYIATHAPHVKLIDPPDHTTDYAGVPSPSRSKPSFDEADTSDKPAYVRKFPPLSPAAERGIDARFRHRERTMREIDDFVGRLVTDLTTSGALANTYIFVTSDNGYMQGEHRLPRDKIFPYEESMRLPLLVRGPGIVPGSHTAALTSIADLFETFTDLAGSPELRDGRSLVPILHGTATSLRNQLLFENLDKQTEVPVFHGVVTGRYKYVEYATGEKELYDLTNDPYELDNAAGTADPALLGDLQTKLHALEACSGDSCRMADSS